MNRYNLSFGSCIQIEDDIWFSAVNYNGLYKYNLKNKMVTRIGSFPNESMCQKWMHLQVCLYCHFLIFIPHYAKAISIYDIEKHTFRQIEIPLLREEAGADMRFHSGVVYQDTLYVIGFKYPGVIKVNLKTYKYQNVYCVPEKLKECDRIYFGTQVAIDENILYIPCCYQNAVLAVNMDYDEVSEIKIGEDSNQYVRIIKDNQYFYLVTKDNNHIVCWNAKENICKEINLGFKKECFDAFIFFNERYIWLLSTVAGEIYQICKSNSQANYFEFAQDVNIEYAVSYQDGVCFLDNYTYGWHYLEEKGVITDLDFYLEEPRSIEEVWEVLDLPLVNKEHKDIPIQYLLFQASKRENTYRKEKKTKKSVGDMVWDQLRITCGGRD